MLPSFVFFPENSSTGILPFYMKHHDLYGYVASSSNLTYSSTEESKANKTVLIKCNLLSAIHVLPICICVGICSGLQLK